MLSKTISQPADTRPPSSPDEPRSAAPVSKAYGCARCGRRWGGAATCHCSRCHETFGNLAGFDRHLVFDAERRVVACLDPGADYDAEKVDPIFRLNARGYWSLTVDLVRARGRREPPGIHVPSRADGSVKGRTLPDASWML